MKTLNLFLSVLLFSGFVLSQDLEYSYQEYNSTSPTYGMDVWHPEYADYITLHYFSTQG